MDNIINFLNKVRDIPYKIPLSGREKDFCCNGKHQKLFNFLIAPTGTLNIFANSDNESPRLTL